MAITKTDFMRGMQCPKMLWLDKHRPDLRVIPPEIQAKLDYIRHLVLCHVHFLGNSHCQFMSSHCICHIPL